MTRGCVALSATGLLLTACVAPEVLSPRDGTVPAGVDLSGNWVIRNSRNEDQRRLREAISRTDGIKDEDIFREPDRQSRSQMQRSRSERSVRGGLVYVFLETGEALKVTQTADGLFISFDRAVVEEFRFGENRLVSVGEVEAQRVTGWEDDELVVETLDRNSMKMTERFLVIDGGQVLQRTITLRSKEGEEETIVQLFDRAAD